jgi:hypothetical protein
MRAGVLFVVEVWARALMYTLKTLFARLYKNSGAVYRYKYLFYSIFCKIPAGAGGGQDAGDRLRAHEKRLYSRRFDSVMPFIPPSESTLPPSGFSRRAFGF